MKTLTTILLFCLMVSASNAQQQVETKSVLLDDFISFIAENYRLSSNDNLEDSDDDSEEDDNSEKQANNIVFLIETTKTNPSQEDVISLKQAFRFLSKRLTESDDISIVAYSGMNGLVLEKTTPSETKKILNALDDLKGQIDKNCRDGIAFAYDYINKSYEKQSINTVVMIRNPLASNSTQNTKVSSINYEQDKSKTGNGTAIVLTAITLLPELIAVIKD